MHRLNWHGVTQASGNAVETTRLRIEGRLITPHCLVLPGLLARSIACPGSHQGRTSEWFFTYCR